MQSCYNPTVIHHIAEHSRKSEAHSITDIINIVINK